MANKDLQQGDLLLLLLIVAVVKLVVLGMWLMCVYRWIRFLGVGDMLTFCLIV